MRPRSSSDPSEQKSKAPLAPSAPMAPNAPKMRIAVAHWGKKSSSGYVGLANQGATCYLNSLLQCLYMTPEFRHALFTWQYKPPANTTFEFDFAEDADDEADTDAPYHDAPPEHSIPFQLQCLFGRLHKSCRGACSTRPLTKSFHWNDGQAFQQHDVQELLRVLFDAVSRALSRVGKGDLLNNLCQGVLLDYLDCQECHSDRSRQDIFLDLSLTIENINTLQDAIQKFITPEIMSEGNQVNCHQCDKKQDFKKGLKFKKLPPLLFIQLKRFHFDWQINRRVKLSHKLTFPKEIDMSTYIDEDILKNEIKNVDDLQYSLYGVIIQSGGALGGHYYAYIKSFEDEKWYCFNDSSVRLLDEKTNEFENAFGGEKVRGTGYVLLYRQTNLKMPDTYGYFPSYLDRMIEKEDAQVKIEWEEWQKEMRTINIVVWHTDTKDIKIKVDAQEHTFESLLRFAREELGITEEDIPLQNTRLRKYYPQHKFIAQGYDDDNLKECTVEIAKWPKHGLNLWLEVKQDIDTPFEYFDPNHLLISLFVVTPQNTEALVDRGFIQSATFRPQDLPPGDICSVVVDSKAPMGRIYPILYNALRENNILPEEWTQTEADGLNLNLIKFDYNRIRVLREKHQSLEDYNIKLGTMLFIELQPKEQQPVSILAALYEEQRLKISVQFNDPLPAKSLHDRVEELLMTPQMLKRKRQNVDHAFKKRLEFNYAVRISKESPLVDLKKQMAEELGLEMNQFRLRKSSNQPELRDMKKTLREEGITDGGLVYVEYGVPTEPKQSCITFSLYDAHKLLTDPHKKKKQLAQKLFEYPFRKDMKVSAIKTEIVTVINTLFPLYRGKYNFIEAIKVLKQEEKEQKEESVEPDADTNTNSNAAKGSQQEVKKEKEDPSVNATPDPNPKRRNLFGIEYVRLRKQRGAKVLEMLFDDLKLSQQIMGNKDSLKLVIEKIPIKEHFTKNHICFCLQKYRPDQGKAWNGKIYRKKEFVIDKNSKIIELKLLIARLLKKTDKAYADRTEDQITKNISITKGFSTSPMRLNTINRLQWVHRAAIHQHGVDPDAYLYRSRNENEDTFNEEEILKVMQTALALENDDVIGRPPFHLRNGDLIVWTDVSWTPRLDQKEQKEKLDKEEAEKRGSALKKNPNFKGTKGGTAFSRRRPQPQQLKITTYDEWLEDEEKKKENKEKEKEQTEQTEHQETTTATTQDTNVNTIANYQSMNTTGRRGSV